MTNRLKGWIALAIAVAVCTTAGSAVQVWRTWSNENGIISQIQWDLKLIDVRFQVIQESYEKLSQDELASELEGLCSYLDSFLTHVTYLGMLRREFIFDMHDLALAINVISGGSYMARSPLGFRVEVQGYPYIQLYDGIEERRYYGSFSRDGALSEGELLFLAELRSDCADINEAIGSEYKSIRKFIEAFNAMSFKWRIVPNTETPFSYLIPESERA
ncbi:MAG: hypothetical protein LBL49_06900 [Clostridiales Family XIII bacterium]|nr:hypothetical protein [Clostridiales Family XIII bacterium]